MLDRRTLRPVAIVFALLLVVAGVSSTLATDDSAFAHSAFARTWDRTDKPVDAGQVSRSWVWGAVLTSGLQESYVNSPGGKRLVQYFDKARMEITHPDAVDDGLWYVTTGLLVNELVTGQVQAGDATFLSRPPAEINIAGDPDNDDAPTYADLAGVLDASPLAAGSTIVQRLDGADTVTQDQSLAQYGVTAAYEVQAEGIDHQVASVFWTFMNSSDVIWQDGAYVNGPLFPNPLYATGYPLTEAYWSRVNVNGVPQDVLWQCFQRRCLTYTPGNAPGWQVEVGNVGMHYYEWRYNQAPGTPTATTTPSSPTPTSTATSTPVPATDQLYAAFLSSEQVVGSGDLSTEADDVGSATAWLHVNADGSAVEFQLPVHHISNITSAQIHLGHPDENGPIVVTLFDGRGAAVTPPKVLAEDSFTADDLVGPLEGQPLAALLNEIAAGDAYVDISTTANPAGEVRGALALGDELLLRADLADDQALPGIGATSSAVGVFYYDADSGTLDYQLQVTDVRKATNAVLQLDDASGGSVVATLFTADDPNPPTDGVLAEGMLSRADLTGGLSGASLARLVYDLATGHALVRLDTETHPEGALVGPAAHWSNGDGAIAFAADLDGNQETSPVSGDASGLAAFRWSDDGALTYELIVAETDDPTSAHIHLGPAGEDGDVVVTLYLGSEDQGERNGSIADGRISDDQLSGPLVGRPIQRLIYALATGNAYVEVRTAEHPDGEMRGQSALVAGQMWIAHLSGIDEVPPVATDASGVAIFQLRPDGQSMHYKIIVSGLADAQQATLHIVTSGDTGPFVAELWNESAANPAVEDGVLIEDFIDDASLIGPLTGSDLETLVAQIPDGEVYANILTGEHPEGEIRGTLR